MLFEILHDLPDIDCNQDQKHKVDDTWEVGKAILREQTDSSFLARIIL